MDRFKAFREKSERVEKKMMAVEKLLQALEDAVSEHQNSLLLASLSPTLPASRRLPGIWRRKVDPSLN